jgi:DNA-binding response OmpR family regulator
MIEDSVPSIKFHLAAGHPDSLPLMEVPVPPDSIVAGELTLDLASLTQIARVMRKQVGDNTAPVTLHVTHQQVETPSVYSFADDRIIVDNGRQILEIDGEEKMIPPRQFSLLSLLASRPDQLWSRAAVHNHIWGRDPWSNVLNVLTSKTRKSLGPELAPALVSRQSLGLMVLSTLKRT